MLIVRVWEDAESSDRQFRIGPAPNRFRNGALPPLPCAFNQIAPTTRYLIPFWNAVGIEPGSSNWQQCSDKSFIQN